MRKLLEISEKEYIFAPSKLTYVASQGSESSKKGVLHGMQRQTVRLRLDPSNLAR